MPYYAAMKSLPVIFDSESKLQKSCLVGGLVFCSFSGIWGSLDILLSSAPFYYNSSIIGWFALVGIFGTLFTGVIGRCADRYGVKLMLKIIPYFLAVSFVLISQTLSRIAFLIVAMVVLDISSRTSLVTNQLVNYTLGSDTRSRVNSLFMCSYFLFGSIGTSIGAWAAVNYGWCGVAVLGVCCSLSVVIINLFWNTVTSTAAFNQS